LKAFLPVPSILSWTILIAAALTGGVVNALAGGGMFLVFPALVMAGIPPISANATASAVTLPGGIASAWVYRKKRSGSAGFLATLIGVSLAGSLSGSTLLLLTSNARFAKVVPWLMLGAALVFSLAEPIRRFAEAHTSAKQHRALLAIGQFFITVYGGYFGAGMGVLMIVLFLVTANLDVQASANLRLWSATTVNLLAVGIFSWRGIVEWRVGVPMLMAAIAGGYLGAHAVKRLSVTMVRRAVLVYAWATGIWLLVRSW
jgi:uncharacterized membrane protein YfcA